MAGDRRPASDGTPRWSDIPGARVLLLGTGRHAPGSALPDVPAVAATLSDLAQAYGERCGIPATAVHVALDPATPLDMGDAVAAAAERAVGLLVVHYVGHGLLSDEGALHLAARSTDPGPTRLHHTALPYATVRHYLQQYLNAGPRRRLVVLLDCCFSGRATAGLNGMDEIMPLAGISGAYVLASAGRDELALALEGERHTAFSGALLHLLTDGDPDGPAEFTLDHVFRRLQQTLPAAGFPRPRHLSEGRTGELVVAANPAYRPVPVNQPTLGSSSPGAARALDSDLCPYKGLAAFETADSPWFFGRETLTRTLVDALARSHDDGRMLAVLGASGSGKSSLLRAGLLPAVGRGELGIARSATWPRLPLTPTADPLAALAEALARPTGVPAARLATTLADDPLRLPAELRRQGCRTPVVIVVDQFEEVFTLSKSAEASDAFIRALHAAAHGDEHGPAALVVLGVRADFYAECMAVPELVPALREHPVVVGPMSTAELRDAVEKPAARAGITLESGLVDVLLSDLGASPLPHDHGHGHGHGHYDAGRLPLLSHALKTAWQQRTDAALTITGYKNTGRIHGALAATAELAMSRLDQSGRAAARGLLLRLVHIGEGTEATKRRATRAELFAEVPDTERAAAVLTAFTMEDTRLITVERDGVEIIHETLLHAWPQLHGWIDENRARLRTEQQLTEAAHAWERASRDPTLLYAGSRLTRAEAWAADEAADSGNPLAMEFVRASGQRRRAAARRRRTALAVLLCALVAVAATLGILFDNAAQQRQQARTQHRTATARGLVFQAESLRDTAPDTALRLGIAAQRLGPGDDARASLMTSLLRRHEPDLLTGHTGRVKAVACSDDGRTVATAGTDRTTLLWDTTNRTRPRRVARLTGHHAPVRAVAFAPGGALLATGGEDRTIILWDVSRVSRPRRLASLTGATSTVETLAVSPDRRSLLTGGAGRSAILWDIADPDRPRRLATLEGGTYRQVHGVAFTPDGRTAVVDGAGESPYIWDVRDRNRPRKLGFAPGRGAEEVYAVAIAPNGRTLAVAYSGNEVVLWDIRQLTTTDNQRQLSVVRVHTRPVHGLAFSPDGRTLATASTDRTARLWSVTDPANPRQLAVLNGHTGPVNAVAFTSDGRTVITGSDDRTVALWDAAERVLPHPTSALAARGIPVLGLALTPDDHALTATTDSSGKRVTLWELTDPGRRRRLASFPAHRPETAVFTQDGRRMALLSHESTKVRLYDLSDPTRPHHASTLTSRNGWIVSAAFSPDGRRLATSTTGSVDRDGNTYSDDAVMSLWDITRPTRPRHTTDLPGGLDQYVVFSPDGRTLVSADSGGPAVLWDIRTPAKPRRRAEIGGADNSFASNPAAAFTPDGKIMALARGDRQATVLYDVSRPHRPRQLASLAGHSDSPQTLAFGARGRLLATAADDGTMILWDITVPTNPRQLTTVTGPSGNPFDRLALSPASGTLATLDYEYGRQKGGLLWDVTEIIQSVTDPSTRACGFVHRGLNRDEWQRATEGLPYQVTCPG
ncbi:AAA family ATPase [Streptomyces sp. NPDC059063]|uniref:caspase, EACC1-associated type n=1 Tax=unclassified Streptomyces TaxID=2593676 RepID=UPI0036926335